jgi:hypothetical protein
MPSEKHEFELFADYFQFYLQDEEADGDLSDAWTPQATDDLLAVADGVIGVGTVRNMDVPVILEIASSAPDDDSSAWDHIAECSIHVPTGRLVIAGCTDYFADAARIDVEPGWYRARVYYGGLDTLSDDGLDGDDRYRIALWPAAAASEPRVVKRRSPTN